MAVVTALEKRRLAEILQKVKAGGRLSGSELASLKKYEAERNEEQMTQVLSRVPQQVLLRLLGDLPRKTLLEWEAAGLPCIQDGRSKFYDLFVVLPWVRNRVSRRDDAKSSWQEEGEKWRALKHKFDLEVKQGKYIAEEVAAAWWEDRLVEMRTHLYSLGASVAPSLVGQDVHAIRSLIHERCRGICESVSRQIAESLNEDDDETEGDIQD